MHLDLAALDSVRDFAENFKSSGRRLDALVCNAAVYLPTAKEPSFTADGFELSVGTNHLGHFLLVHLLVDKLKEAPNKDPRWVHRKIGTPGFWGWQAVLLSRILRLQRFLLFSISLLAVPGAADPRL